MLYIQEKRGGNATGLRSIPFKSNADALAFMENLVPSPGYHYSLTIIDGVNDAGLPKCKVIVKG
jgi:hypothetical protein